MAEPGKHRRHDEADGDGESTDSLLPVADPELTDAEKFSTDEGSTEEDLDP